MKRLVWLAIMVSAPLAAQPATSADPPVADALAFFDDMCVRTLLNEDSAVDPRRFGLIKISEKDAREALPEFDPTKAWAVVANQSGVRMFFGLNSGICSTEILHADRGAVETGFAELVATTAAGLKTTAKLEQSNQNPVNGKPASFSAWRVKTPKGDILLALTATTPGAAGVQHLMTASPVK